MIVWQAIMKFFKTRFYVLVYFWISFLIFFPLLAPGYILTVDMVIVPDINTLGSLDFSSHMLLWHVALSVLNFVIPSWLIQKLMLIAIFGVSGIAMYRFFPFKEKLPKYCAGFFYVVNPFVYSRLMAGHVGHLAAYAVFPILVKSYFDLIKDNSFKNILKTLFLLSLTAVMSLPFLYMGAVIFALVVICQLWQNRNSLVLTKSLMKAVFLIAFAFVAVNFYWLFSAGTVVESFDLVHREAYMTAKDPVFGLFFNILSLYGFWGETSSWAGTIIWPKDLLPFWHVVFLLVFLLVIYGLITAFRKVNQRKYVFVFLISAIFAFIFSIGIAHSSLRAFNEFAYEYLPFFKGFREAQKWSLLLVFTYCVFLGIGLKNLNEWMVRNAKFSLSLIAKLQNGLVAFVIFLISLYTFPLFLLGNQLKPVWYPQSWYVINEIMSLGGDNARVLFLPWHMYMSFEFNNNRLVANPAMYFFDVQVLQGDNIELGRTYSTSENSQSNMVVNYLNSDIKNDQVFADLLRELDVKYIIYASDTEGIERIDYSFLSSSKALKAVYREDQLTLYEVVFD